MARSSRKQAEVTGPTSVLASAAQLSGSSLSAVDNSKLRRGLAWQDQAWKYYDLIGEYRYACDWVGSMLSKARLQIQRRKGSKVQVREEGLAADLLEEFFGGRENQVEMLRQMGVHLTVAGECYIVGWTRKGVEEWLVVASVEITKRGNTWFISGEKIEVDEDADEPYVLKIWLPHPRRHLEATSPSKAVLPILGEIHALTQHVGAQVISRLAGAGILLVSTEMKLPEPPESEDGTEVVYANDADQLMATLTEAMNAAIRDRESASAVTPIVVQAPSEAIEHIKHLTFWTPLDEKSVELRNEAIRRLALGMDMPPEILTGTGDLNHWNAWLSDESSIKAHTEPLLRRITGDLTQKFLKPLLVDEDDNPIDDGWVYSVSADDSQMRLRPNRSKEAFELWDRNELKGTSLRRETGFDDSDRPDDEERRFWMLRKIAGGSATPEQVEQALQALKIFDIATSGQEETREERPNPSLEEHPKFDPPDEPDPGLVAAADVLCLRALERAGNRMKSRLKLKPPGVSAAALYQLVPGDDRPAMDDLLEDAWTHVPEYAARFGVCPEQLTAALDTYCRLLIAERADRDEGTLRKHLALVPKET